MFTYKHYAVDESHRTKWTCLQKFLTNHLITQTFTYLNNKKDVFSYKSIRIASPYIAADESLIARKDATFL